MDKPARDGRLDREARKAASKYDFVKVRDRKHTPASVKCHRLPAVASGDATDAKPAGVTCPAHATSQVKVWLGEEGSHYYVLSRFLVSRSLTVTKIPHLKAVKIALELKKFCVDNDMLDISQVSAE